jgi:DNA-binding NtrC family response regulator
VPYDRKSGRDRRKVLLYLLSNRLKVEEEAQKDGAQDRPSQSANAYVLVVDDDENVLSLLETALRFHDFNVIAFLEARLAMEFVRSNPSSVGVAIIDETMPFIKGSELAKEIHGLLPNLPIILTSGYGELVAPESGDNLLFIAKPFKLPELMEKVGELLFSHKSEGQSRP